MNWTINKRDSFVPSERLHYEALNIIHYEAKGKEEKMKRFSFIKSFLSVIKLIRTHIHISYRFAFISNY